MRHAWERPLLLVLITAAKHVEIVNRSRGVPVQAHTVVQITSSRVAAPMQVSCHQEIPDPGTAVRYIARLTVLSRRLRGYI